MTFVRSHPVTFTIALIMCIFIFFNSVTRINNWETIKIERLQKLKANLKGDPLPTFLSIARKHGTDKVSPHSYHNMYEKYLSPLRLQPLKMLEIGLGCDMAYGPGASYYTWLEYLPKVDLYYIEYNALCAEKWASATTGATIFTGDQADVAFLEKFLKETAGEFDVIVDDGGHTMVQQMTSFDALFPALKPGGIYFVEDLQTSYMANYGGGAVGSGMVTMMERIKGNLDDLITGAPRMESTRDVSSIDCMREVCAFSKKEVGREYKRDLVVDVGV